MVNTDSTRLPRKGLLLLTTLALVAVAFTLNVPTVSAVGCKSKTIAPSAVATTTPEASSVDDYTDDGETIPSDASVDEYSGEDDEAENEAGVIAPAPATKTPKPTKTKKAKTPKPSKKPKSTKAPKTTTVAPKATTAPAAAEEDAEEDSTPAPEDDTTPAPAPAPSMTTKTPTTKAPTPAVTKASTPAAAGNATLPSSSSTSGKCVTGDPTQYISKAYVDWIWEHRMKTEVIANTRFFYNQLMENKGKLRYCIRWDSTNKLPKATASKFKAMLEQQYAQWNKWLTGYGCWPFTKIEVEIVGVAVTSKALLDWTDDSLGTIYEKIVDSDGKPMCSDACFKYGADAGANCPGKVFDVSLWSTLGLGGGFGYDWGQQVDEDSVISSLGATTSHIVAHEIGHGFGLPDFYEASDKPGADMPAMIMEAGASMVVTEGDGWLLRRGWENVRSRWPETSG